ncbi:hypothetical protein BTN33_08775 [Aeromonas veronii]|uniref:hypothetical protein n=1 Tax=Aeromonas veronii TaxID=654 RepID=UPI0009470682|nr:hypothetical protein [Aeromonas veronii]OLF59865.1 hypothetical protein BTN33_08775 [Aeromonas veronii]
MTTIRPSNVTALSAMQEQPLVSDRMAAFMAEELLPMMAGSWPASANYLDANARGVVLAWGSLLRGFNAQQIREAVLLLGEDADRQFAPRPAEVRAAILRNNDVPRAVPVGRQVSLRVCEMEAEVRVYLRDRSVPAEEVVAELQVVLAEKAHLGVAVTGTVA